MREIKNSKMLWVEKELKIIQRDKKSRNGLGGKIG